MKEKPRTRLLKGSEEIAEYLGVSVPTARKYIDLGLPCVIIHGAYHAHQDNIEEFFRAVTRKRSSDDPEIK